MPTRITLVGGGCVDVAESPDTVALWLKGTTEPVQLTFASGNKKLYVMPAQVQTFTHARP